MYSPVLHRLLPILLVVVLGLEARANDTITLDAAYDRTLATDQSIRIAYINIKQANLQPWSALTLLAPSIYAGAGLARNASTQESVGSVAIQGSIAGTTIREFVTRGLTNETGTSSADLTLSQTLIDLSVFPSYRLGRLTVHSARLAQRYTIRKTLFGVATAYYQVLDQHRLVEVDRLTLQLSKEELEVAEKRANVGEVTRVDVLNAQVQVQQARQALISDENTLELNLNTMRNILNFPPEAPISLVEPPSYPTTLEPFETLLGRALQRREDFLVTKVTVDQDVESKNVIRAHYAPKITMGADSGLGNTYGDSRVRTSNWDFDIAVQVPIFTGGQREIQLANAMYQITQDELSRDQAAKGVENDVKTAWLNVRTLDETLKAARSQVAAADQSYQDQKNQYAAGAATSVQVLLALQSLDSARKNLIVQTYAYQIALRNVEYVTGVFQEERAQRARLR
jgi:outer membrane protein TolC